MRIITLSICALLTTASALSMHTMRVKTLLPLFSKNTTLSNSVANNLMRFASTSKSQYKLENLIGGCSTCDATCKAKRIEYMEKHLHDEHTINDIHYVNNIEVNFPIILKNLPGCSKNRVNRMTFVAHNNGKIDPYYKQAAYTEPIIVYYQGMLKDLNEKARLCRSVSEKALYQADIDNVQKIIATLKEYINKL